MLGDGSAEQPATYFHQEKSNLSATPLNYLRTVPASATLNFVQSYQLKQGQHLLIFATSFKNYIAEKNVPQFFRNQTKQKNLGGQK